MSSGHGIDQLHVRFNFGVLSSCRIDVFDRCHPPQTLRDGIARSLRRFKLSPDCNSLALVVTGLLGEGDGSDDLAALQSE